MNTDSTAAQVVAPPPPGENLRVHRTVAVSYEQHLSDLYVHLAALYAGHTQHQIRAGSGLRLVGPGDVGHGGDRTCKVNARCTVLADATLVMLTNTFTPDAIDGLLETATRLIDIRFGDPARSIREACVEAFRYDAEINRLFPQGAICPVDPAVTRP